MKSLFYQFDNIIIFDVETTGTNPKKDEIIEFAALRVTDEQATPAVAKTADFLVNLPPGKNLSSNITNLTGITEKKLSDEGISKEDACKRIAEILKHHNSLLAAYNAHFDLCFLYYFLNYFDATALLKNIKFLDVLTIFKDRKPYPHKLSDAIKAYSIDANNSHCASDDAKATFELLCKMGTEEDDLEKYINLFGYNPKYGISGSRISSVTYKPQRYNMRVKLYEQ